jgi:PhzF family phenazine biosynthesis protein
MTRRRFQQVDVFGSGPLSGNPLAVILDSAGLETAEMEKITRWMNLSETTFLLPPESPEADYKVRIFTLGGELPFAGHPTLGTCHVWRAFESPRSAETIVQECGLGLVRIRPTAGGFAFAAPRLLREGPVEDRFLAEVAAVLGIEMADIVDSRWVDNGPGWVGVLLEDAEKVLGLEPRFPMTPEASRLDIGVVGPHPPGSEHAYEIRAFFSNDRGEMVEDPVTGSLNASVAQWMLETGRVTAPYLARQGTRLQRAGRVSIDQDADGIVWVGGSTVTVIEGTIDV